MYAYTSIQRIRILILVCCKTIIQAPTAGSRSCTRLTYGAYASNLLLAVYGMIRTIMFHLVVSLVSISSVYLISTLANGYTT